MLVILASGIFIRFSHYTLEGYDEDSTNVLAGATYWYYPPYKMFPGMIYQEPPLGDIIIGAGCMASGEDFSGVRQVTPLFGPDRAVLFGQAAAKAEKYCFFPVYLFGVIFLIIIAIMAVIMLNKYSAIFFTAFFAYCPVIIKWSRLIHVDSILWAFVAAGILFLWLGYSAEQNIKCERRYFILSFLFFGMAGATKYTAGAYFIFAPLLFIGKYKSELKIYIGKLSHYLGLDIFSNLANERINVRVLKTLLISTGTMIIAFLAPFKFNPKNVFDMYNVFTTQNRPDAGAMHFSWNFFKGMYYFFVNMNVFESIVLLLGIFIFIIIIFKKNKDKLEKFILYLLALQFICMTLVGDIVLGIGGIFRSVPFMFGFVLLMALVFSDMPYALGQKIKPKYIYAFLIIFIIFSAVTVYRAPFFQKPNDIVCIFDKETCNTFGEGLGQAKASAKYLKTVIQDNETFLYGDISTAVYYYLRPETSVETWNLIAAYLQQTGRRPTLEEYVYHFRQAGKPIRYILLYKHRTSDDREEFKNKYAPNHIVKAEGGEVAYVYDVENLIPKSTS